MKIEEISYNASVFCVWPKNIFQILGQPKLLSEVTMYDKEHYNALDQRS